MSKIDAIPSIDIEKANVIAKIRHLEVEFTIAPKEVISVDWLRKQAAEHRKVSDYLEDAADFMEEFNLVLEENT